ncbi:unnamed protein product [Coffea canephora]|uniref:Stress enhanced protein 2, chloroplastic n=1 Tax=Coffea canephora TaxID=49390 RepID=A0A068UZ40_COFCA|nr:unnamed protein product [Coffea canephora]
MALARPVFCELKSQNPVVEKSSNLGLNLQVQKARVPAEVTQTSGENGGSSTSSSSAKIVLQPRLCTLRTYGSDRVGVMKTKGVNGEDDQMPRFFATLSEYIESSKKSHDFEIISGRLAMVVFAATVGTEVVTGNSIFRKMDLQGIAGTAGFCVAAVTCAAVFAWFSSARNRVGRIFTVSCNTFIESLIDQIIDGLFYDNNDFDDWSDDI